MAQTEFLWLAVYRIDDPDRRRRVKEILRFAGSLVRPCVYEIVATDTGLRRLLNELTLHLDKRDRLRFYRICADCRDRCVLFGEGELAQRLAALII